MLHLIHVLSILGIVYSSIQLLIILNLSRKYSLEYYVPMWELYGEAGGPKYFWLFILSLVVFLNT